MENKSGILFIVAIIILLYFYYNNKIATSINTTPPLLSNGVRVQGSTPSSVLQIGPQPIITKSDIPTLTAAQAVDKAIALAPRYTANAISSGTWLPSDEVGITFRQALQKYVYEMQMTNINPAYLSGRGTNNSGLTDMHLEGTIGNLTLTSLNTVRTVSQLTTGFAAAGTALGSAIPIVGTIVSGIVSLFNAISAHHAAAVANEQNLEGQLVPAANNYLNIIKNAVASGQASFEEGIAALDSLLRDFTTAATDGSAGELKNTSGECNAMCDYWVELNAIVFYWKSKYAAHMLS